jgi:excisionase family DNA binding protein
VPEPTLADLLAAIERIEKSLAALEAHLEPLPRLLSKRRAAELLGIGRDEGLDRLIRSGTIKAMKVGTRLRIALPELERFLREGPRPPPRVSETFAPGRFGHRLEGRG